MTAMLVSVIMLSFETELWMNATCGIAATRKVLNTGRGERGGNARRAVR
jgi:hypothetical protein